MAGNSRHAEPEEGSGLIDIAALADLKSETRLAAIDPLSAPTWVGGAVMPKGDQRKPRHRLVFVLLGGACLASVGVVGLALVMAGGQPGVAGGLGSAAGAAQEGVGAQAPFPARAPAGTSEVAQAAPQEPLVEAPESSKPEPAAVEPEPPAAQADQAEADDGHDRRREDRQRRREREASSLPKAPSRGEVLEVLTALQSKVKRCGRGQSGVVTLDLRVNGPRGRVSSVQVSGLSGSAASCAKSAARGARFPRFADKRFAVRYPVKL